MACGGVQPSLQASHLLSSDSSGHVTGLTAQASHCEGGGVFLPPGVLCAFYCDPYPQDTGKVADMAVATVDFS